MQDNKERPVLGMRPRPPKDLPGCIKWIILAFLVVLLLAEFAAGDFNKVAGLDPLASCILLIKLILIAGLLALIRVQRDLTCNITAPSGCATLEYDPVHDRTIIRVKGTASGVVFGNYTLAVSGMAVPVIYPGGGSSGSPQVVNGELGQLDFSGLDPQSGLTVTLTVNPAGAGSSKTCSKTFAVQRRMVFIDKIGSVPARVIGPHPDDTTQVLKEVMVSVAPAPPGPEASLADSISVVGSADVYGCGRQMSEYVLQYLAVASPNNPWLPNAAGAWSNINAALPFGDATHPRTYSFLGTIQLPNYVLNGKLTRQWVSTPILQSLSPLIYANRWVTQELAWGTAGLNGRYTVRLLVKHQPLIPPPDPTPPELYDAATVWLDNRGIDGKITGMAVAGGGALGACDELLLSQFVQMTPSVHKVNANIIGRAWDPLILDSYPHTMKPNDNFGSYTLQFEKDGTGTWNSITSSVTRVPNILQQAPLPALPAGTGTLAGWDIVGALDAGPGGPPPDPSPKIYRGQRCAYVIQLHVQDTTMRGDGGGPHEVYDLWPFCIMNDLSSDTRVVPFPVPA